MGLFSDVKAAADVQRIKNGGTAKLSISQITGLIVNMSDARRNLGAAQFEDVYALYGKLRKCKTKVELDINGYYDTSSKIIVSFNRIAPYEKFSGTNEVEAKFLLMEIEKLYGDKEIDIDLNPGKDEKNRDAGKRNHSGGRIIGVAVAVVVIAFLCLYFYVHNVSSYFNVEDSVYYAADDRTEIYYHFTEDNTLEMIFSMEYKNYVGRAVYTYSGSYWNHLFGDFYFSGKSMLSLKNVEPGAKPATANLICKENFYLDLLNGEIEKYEDQELTGQIFTSEFMFYDDYMTVDGTLFTKVEEVNPVYAELIQLSDYF